jgi:hypothetical protein
MKSVKDLFLVAVLLVPLHVVEQLMFGLDELYELRSLAGAAANAFGDPDFGAVVLVGAVTTLVLFFCYGFMAGGAPRLIAAGFFGLEFMGESHHLIKTVIRGEYFPGAVTAIALVVLGAFVLRRAWLEFHQAAPAPAEGAAVAA